MKFKKRKAPASRPVGGWLKWLRPGLFVKRWLLVSTLGVILVGLGIAISARLTPVLFLSRIIGSILDFLVNLLPRGVSGPLAILGGLFLLWWGHRRALGAVTQPLLPNKDRELVDVLIDHRRLNRGPKLVAIGGGTGLSTLLRGLKRYSANITAIVTVADDGGSSGRLRREHGVLPPGDIRNCLAALSDEEKLMTELFQYRFEVGEGLSGHSFGNLFLTAMSDITGNLEKAITASSQVLAVRGRVLPSTLEDVVLWARFEDGRYVEGESQIPLVRSRIVEFGCKPERPAAVPQTIKDIADADFIIIGPGSLYTSIIPNLLVPEILTALKNRQVPCVYVCNVMSQEGETDGFTISDYVETLDRVAGARLFDVVLVQKDPPSERSLAHYRKYGAEFTVFDRERLSVLKCPVLLANVMAEREDGTVRHDSDKLAGVLMRWYNRQ
jgi:uncharacterized cofD-like protein